MSGTSPAELVVEAVARMRQTGMTVSSLGNVSVRRGEHVWITPTRVLPWDLRAEDLVVLRLDGTCLVGDDPSSEGAMHVELYRRYPGVASVVHTHCPWGTAWSHLGRDLDMRTEELRYHGLQRIRCSRAAAAGTEALAHAAAEALEGSGVALLRRHGVVAVGDSPTRAFELCALAEQQAQVHWLLRLERVLEVDRVSNFPIDPNAV